mgnify:CR=1 FL=1
MVNRSARHIHVQLINDLDGTTVAAATSTPNTSATDSFSAPGWPW